MHGIRLQHTYIQLCESAFAQVDEYLRNKDLMKSNLHIYRELGGGP